MVMFFRRLLIKIGKIIPFVFAAIIASNHIEIIYAIINDVTIVDIEGNSLYAIPIINFLANIIYIDWVDVLLVYILCFALELCKYTFRCAHYMLLNLAVRNLLETFQLQEGIIIPICITMATMGFICLLGGFKMIPSQKGHF